MTEIDLGRYIRTGAGAMGESFDSLDDPDMMLKLYNAGHPYQPIIDELDIARKVYSLGIPSPEPGELVRVGDRIGIRFRKVHGKRSFSRAMADEPERAEEFGREYAGFAKKIHSVHCPAGMFPTEKDLFLTYLDADKIFDAAAHEKIRRFIEAMPDVDTAVHGDLHMGNFLTTLPKGEPMSTPHEVLAIDLGNFATGTPLLDIGMMMNVSIITSEEFRTKEMHAGIEVTSRFWKGFVDEYFFGPEELGKRLLGDDTDRGNIEERLLPYAAIKSLLVEYDAHYLPEEYADNIRKAFGVRKIEQTC